MVRPVRRVSPTDPGAPCWSHDPYATPVADDHPLTAVDFRTRLGAWRRETVCGRCVGEFLHQCSRDGDVVAWTVDAGAELAEPGPLGGADVVAGRAA